MRIRIRRALVLGVVLAVLAGGQPVVAQQPPSPRGTLAAIDYQVELSGETDVCTNVEYTYSVRVVKYYGYLDGSTLTYYRQGTVPATITITVRGQTASGRTHLFGGTSFPARFPDEGTYTITATGSGVPIIPGSSNWAHVDPWTIHVTAKSCDYELETLSVWYHLPDGFKPWVGGVMDAVLLRPASSTSNNFVGTGHLRTFAIGGAQGGCVPTFDVEDVDVQITGYRGQGSSFYLELVYASGTSQTSVVCGSLSGQSRQSIFRLESIAGTLTDPWESHQTESRAVRPHLLHASADVNGITYVMLTKL